MVMLADAMSSSNNKQNSIHGLKAIGLKHTESSEFFDRYGFPKNAEIIEYSGFIVSYDLRNRIAVWVWEHVGSEKSRIVERSKCNFQSEPRIHHYFRSSNADYKKSGYDRGHLAAAGNHLQDQTSYQETFSLSNVAPQVGEGFNRDAWNRLEKYARKLAKNNLNVYIYTGPLFLPRQTAKGKFSVKYEVLGANFVAVPTHFYKIIVVETLNKESLIEGYVMPNRKIDADIPISSFRVPLEVIEKSSGILFFSK